jgi:Xaa-Pro aminopeptidase
MKKINELLTELKKIKCDGLLVSNPANIKYLSGAPDVGGYLLITPGRKPVYFTNFIQQGEARKIKDWQVVVCRGGYFNEAIKTIKAFKLAQVGFEAKHLSFLEYKKIKEKLNESAVDFIPATDLIERLRAVKTAGELSRIKKAIAITEQALDFTKEIQDTGMSEKSLAIEVEKFLKIKGDSAVAFPTIVATGKNSALPHHIAGQTLLNKNFFLIDLGARSYEYCADLTRVFFWGKMPPHFRKIYAIVKKAQNLAIAKIKDGVRAKDVDAAARVFIEKKGFGKYFGHGLGHGVGIEVHELPYLNQTSEEILTEGMVVTIEPAIYLAGKFGIRIENMVLVKKQKGEVISGSINW